MTTQLVKKKFGGKRKGYKGSKWKWLTGGGAGTTLGIDVLANPDPYMNMLRVLMGGKHGGRVTKRGIGKAKRGFGKVLRKK